MKSPAAERVALVIGNGGYTGLQALVNPRNDATAMAQALKGLGYRLVGREGQPADGPLVDLDQEGLLEATDAFARAASGQEIAFLYYAGHGFQDGASSYLVPVDAPKPRKNIEILKGRSVPLDRVIRGLDGKAQMVVAVFDACREIPELEAMAGQSRGGGLSGEGGSYRGLLRVEGTSPSGRLIAYAGAAGQLVKDGAGNHSPYTQLLLDRLGVAVTEKKNVELTIFFQQVAWDFRDHQEGQRPLLEISAKPSTFYLLPGPVGDQELVFWNSVKDSRNPAVFRIYLDHFPSGTFARQAHLRLAKLEGGTEPEPPPLLPDPSPDRELAFWNSVKDSRNPADFRAYLDQYPAGAFAKLAQNRLDELEAARKAEEERLAALAGLERKKQEAARKAELAAEQARLLAQQRQREEEAARKAEAKRLAELEQQSTRGTIGPSFDCRKAQYESERMICVSAELSSLDRQMADAYRTAVSRLATEQRTAHRKAQNYWLRQIRDHCQSEACLADEYRSRIRELEAYYR